MHAFYQRTNFRDGNVARWLSVAFGCWIATTTASGQEQPHPLQPPDRSSPRAALKTFLDSGDAVATFLARDYLPSPSRAEFHRLVSLGDATVQSLNLSELPPAARQKTGRAAALALYDTISRIQLPAFDQIPDTDKTTPPGNTNIARWVIPNTEIALERVQSGPRSGEFLFSPDTVAKAGNFYERVRGLAYSRPVPLEDVKEVVTTGAGWLIPYRWVQAMPPWLRAPLAEQSRWKWIALAFILGVFAILLRVAYQLSRRGSSERPFLQALAQLALPVFLLAATPVVAYLALLQLNLFGRRQRIGLAATAVCSSPGRGWRGASRPWSPKRSSPRQRSRQRASTPTSSASVPA
jgi:MscS family membrane protein